MGYTLKGELGKFADLRGLGEKKRVVFLRGVDTLMHTMVCIKAIFKYAKSYSELEKLLKSLPETCKDIYINNCSRNFTFYCNLKVMKTILSQFMPLVSFCTE